jgi:hypothetical protein
MIRSHWARRFGAAILFSLAILFGYQNCSTQMSGASGADASALSSGTGSITITAQPVATTIAVGGTGTLSLSATSATGLALYYQWFLNSTTVANGNSPVLNIINASSTNEGYYYASVTDGTNTVYTSAVWVQVGAVGSSSTLSSTGTCTTGTYYNGACYIFVSSLQTFNQAESYCQTQGGNLAAVQSSADNSFMQSLAAGSANTWLGATNLSTGYYVWESGGDLSYLNWSPGEPNNDGGNEHCLEMYSSGLWNDVNCGKSFASICQISN